MGFLFLTFPVMAETPLTEVYIQGHRCLVVEPADLPSNAPVVVMLHGFGTNRYELLHLCDQLGLPPCLFVLPDAPLRVARASSEAHAWYDRYTHSRKDMENSRAYLFAVMDHFSKGLTDPSPGLSDPATGSSDPSTPVVPPQPRPVIIMGFSQGALMSLEAGLNYPGNIEAIVSMSGFIEYPQKTMAHPLAPRQTPILLVHGEWDPVVQEEDTQETMRVLKRAGYHPVLKEFLMGHKVTYNTINAVSAFLQEVFAHNSQ
jgi:phospholipase/carboxylesterase